MALRRRWKVLITLGIIGLATVVAAVAAARIPFSSDTLRTRVIAALEQKLDAEVELDALTLRLLPLPGVSGAGLRVHHRSRQDVPPLISVNAFRVNSGFGSLWRRRVDNVRLEGLVIRIPPDDDDANDQLDETREKAEEVARTTLSTQDGAEPDLARQVVITTLEAPDAQLIILRRDPTRPVRTWYLHSLLVHEVSATNAMPFESVLTNGVPPGEIETSGSFGPWNGREPGRTPLQGRFTFEQADLSVFKGISGTLSAKGTFGGELERIVVDGQTETPDFMINLSGHPVPLTTTYHAVVDATNGNTTLDPVNATFVETSLVARGGVYDVEGVNGRIVKLDVQMEDGHLEDLMRLAVKTAKPPMAGTLDLTTTMTLPPGPMDVVEKLQLDGRFRINGGRFTDAGVQGKVNELSRRASGKVSEMPVPARVASVFEGQFKLGRGRLAIPTVTFDVPGAIVSMGGAYSMRAETIDFAGELHMDAKISQTVTGYKSWLLKLADPLFRRDGRTVIPLKVDGTRNDPHFGLDMKRVFKRGDSKPAPKKAAAQPPSLGAAGVTPRLSLR